jgi:Tfp pilus assembly protein PilX
MKKKGAALLVVIIIMMLTFLLASIMIKASIRNLRVSSDALDSTKAYYCAESGVYDAINYVELLAASGSLNASSFQQDIPIYNLYSLGENSGSTNTYLFGDGAASYKASIKWDSRTDLNAKLYFWVIYSQGTYNNENYLINTIVKIYYDSSAKSYKYIYVSKLCSKY